MAREQIRLCEGFQASASCRAASLAFQSELDSSWMRPLVRPRSAVFETLLLRFGIGGIFEDSYGLGLQIFGQVNPLESGLVGAYKFHLPSSPS